MESFGVYLDLQEDTLNNYTVSVFEIEQSKQVPKTEKKKSLAIPDQKNSQILITINISR